MTGWGERRGRESSAKRRRGENGKWMNFNRQGLGGVIGGGRKGG